MKNQVIKVLDIEHGKKVIQYWKNQGVDTKQYEGSNVGYYYGFDNDGLFSGYSKSLVINQALEIITLPEEFVLPKRWAIKIDNHKEVLDYLKVNGGADRINYKISDNKWYYHFPHVKEYNCQYLYLKQGYTEITFEQFKKYVLKQNDEIVMKKIEITVGQLREAYSKYNCTQWKTTIEDFFNNPFAKDNDKIEIPQHVLTVLEKSVTKEQKEYAKSLGIIVGNTLPESWEQLKNIEGFYVDEDLYLCKVNKHSTNDGNCYTWPTKELAEASIALAQLLQLRDAYNASELNIKEIDWSNPNQSKYIIEISDNKIKMSSSAVHQRVLAFKTAVLRTEFFNAPKIKELMEIAKPLL